MPRTYLSKAVLRSVPVFLFLGRREAEFVRTPLSRKAGGGRMLDKWGNVIEPKM